MSQPEVILLVRFKSKLSLCDVSAVVENRAPEFRALKGLQQKYYLHDAESGEYAGLYLWDSAESLAAYRESELRKTIVEAYQVVGTPRIEVFRVTKSLRED